MYLVFTSLKDIDGQARNQVAASLDKCIICFYLLCKVWEFGLEWTNFQDLPLAVKLHEEYPIFEAMPNIQV